MALIRVFEIPRPDGKFCFGGGKPTNFQERDWFRNDKESLPPGIDFDTSMTTEAGRRNIRDFIKDKHYFSQDKAYLVLSEDGCFTIGYTNDFMFADRLPSKG